MKKKRKRKTIYFILMIIIGIIIYKRLSNSKINLNDREFTNIIIDSTFTYNDNKVIDKIINKTLEITNPIKLMNRNYNLYVDKQVINNNSSPIIYLYNSHQSEEYAFSDYAEFSVTPTVIMNDYILEDIFNKNGYKTIVEEDSIKDILNNNNWNYSNSYKASRILLEKRILEYPSLKYFIDIHRDSLEKDKTTIEIEGKKYAKVIFLIGLENPNYEENLAFTEKINNKLNEYYPNLSKGIYKKGGVGVNGVYNQDFSNTTILIEIGGYQNTTNEVLNTTIAFSKVFMEVINE